MKNTAFKSALAMVLLVVAVLGLGTSTALAQSKEKASLQVRTASATDIAVGDEVAIEAVLTASGIPVRDAEVTFMRTAEFMNSSSDIVMGTAITDSSGVAHLTYVPRSEGDLLLSAEFSGNTGYSSSYGETKITVANGPEQYTQDVGISVPGINVSLLVILVGAVWGTFLFVMYLVLGIARDGAKAAASGGTAGE